MSISRTMKRRMARDGIRQGILEGRVACPSCGELLKKGRMMSKKVKCTKCAWTGRLR